MEGYWIIERETGQPLEFIVGATFTDVCDAADGWEKFLSACVDLQIGHADTFGGLTERERERAVEDAHIRHQAADTHAAVPEAKCSCGVPWSEHTPDVFQSGLMRATASPNYDLLARGVDIVTPGVARFCEVVTS